MNKQTYLHHRKLSAHYHPTRPPAGPRRVTWADHQLHKMFQEMDLQLQQLRGELHRTRQELARLRAAELVSAELTQQTRGSVTGGNPT